MMTETSVGDGEPAVAGCWCCGAEVADDERVALGGHPEVVVCLRCAKWLGRRAQRLLDERAALSLTAAVRRRVFDSRETIISHGLQRRPVIGRVLRWLDRRLP